MTRQIAFASWATGAELDRGVHQGTRVVGELLTYGDGAGVRSYTDPHVEGAPRITYDWAIWISPHVTTEFQFTSLIPSWNARTPKGTWLDLEVRVSRDGIFMGPWYPLARWAEDDSAIHSTSVPGHDDDEARVLTDVLQAADGVSWNTYQLRVALMRHPDATEGPTVSLVSAVVAGDPVPLPETSPPGPARGVELAVPPYSQQLHRGVHPNQDTTGEAWCSPTSTSMVLDFWEQGPRPEEYAWVEPDLVDRFVPFAARRVFDHAYGGAGNWSFNTAYAARYGTTAFVTRLADLTEAELFIAAGIPLVATVSFTKDELAGAGYDTDGHLLTIIGFDETGDVVCNDPASHGLPSNDEVRTVYDRAEFERIWLGCGGVVYVIHPASVPLPPLPPLPPRPASPLHSPSPSPHW